jgi:acetylornithine/N-succinyldiaminopimelate aminotransferase
LATAVGSAVLDIVNTEEFLQNVNALAGTLRQALEGLVANHPKVFKSVRGTGLMIGVECVVPNMDVVNAGYDFEILTVPGGANVVRLLPALNITSEELMDAVARLDRVAVELEKTL